MSKYERKLKERKEKDGKNIEFKVERNVAINNKTEKEIIKETVEKIITNIESNDYTYYVGNSKTLIEVVKANPKYLRSVLNESEGDNIDNLPTYTE